MTVFKKLIEARVKIQNMSLKQTGKNDFSKYSYYELKDFLPHVNSVFSDIGLCGVVSFTDELATLTIHDVDDNTNIVFTSPMSSANLKGCHPVQNIGAVETYQRRYLYITALEIVESDILDNSSSINDQGKLNTQATEKKYSALIASLDAASQKGADAMQKFWEGLSTEDAKILGQENKKKYYHMAKAVTNGTVAKNE